MHAYTLCIMTYKALYFVHSWIRTLMNSRLIPTKIKLSPAEAERLRAAFSQYWSSFSRPMKTGSENSKSLSGEPFAGALFVWGTELK